MNEIARHNHNYPMNGKHPMTLENLFHQMLFEPFSTLGPEFMSGADAVSRIDVEETPAAFIAKLPFSGAKPESFEVEVIGDMLTIHAERNREPVDMEGKRYIRKERSFESYEETIRLPASVRGSEAKASYRDGILTIELPRMESKCDTRKISVR